MKTTIRKVLVPRFGDESVLQVIDAKLESPQAGEVQVQVRVCYETRQLKGWRSCT